MTTYIVRRIWQAIVVLMTLLTVVFLVTQGLGDPARLMLPELASEQQYQELRRSMGFDDPLLTQYGRFMSRAIRGDFGNSVWQRTDAMELILDRLPATLLLAGVTTTVAILIALPLGVISALAPGSWADRLSTVFSLAGICIPNFWLALTLILLLSVHFKLLPTSGFGEPKHLILPVLALVWQPIGRLAQIARTSMLDEMGQLYVVAAQAKGLDLYTVIVRHVFRNAAIPVLTLASAILAAFINGSTIVETIFAWPGVGKLMIDAIQNRDLALLQGTVFIVATLTVVLNLLVDMTYAAVDPRARSNIIVSR